MAVVIVVVEVVNVADVVVVVEVVKVVEVGAVVKAFFFGYHFLNLKRSLINDCVRCLHVLVMIKTVCFRSNLIIFHIFIQ